MIKKYCFDTSGFSTPLEQQPDDIYQSLWGQVTAVILRGHVAVNEEIYEETCHIGGTIGLCISANKPKLLMRLEDDSWDVQLYLRTVAEMKLRHGAYISEYCGGSPKTVGLNDISIIALAKTLGIPLVSMEAEVLDQTAKKQKIPNVCKKENVEHLNFNAFLRKEGIRLI